MPVTSVAFVKKWRGTSPPLMDLGLATSPKKSMISLLLAYAKIIENAIEI
jgi:hypothetical protein